MRLEVSDREFCYECRRHVAMTVDIGSLDHEDEDAIVVAMCAADATVAEIAAAVNRDTSYVYACVKRLHVQPRRLPVGRPAGQALRPACARCGVLLARAPAGDDGICGWCIEEEPQ